jgi:serine/threonine-protein kinase
VAHQLGLVAQAIAAGPSARNDAGYEDSLLLGQVVGERYYMEQRIGCGGMGVVYRARHVAIEKSLAVKVLRMQYLEVEDVAERFAQEARIASKIKHINVVDITDYGSTAQGAPYFVMEYLAGHSLAYEIDNFGKVEPSRALNIAAQLASGLAAAHEHGIVHRDLKPDNILLCSGPNGETAKILDFGIARVLGSKSRLTAEGAVIGTPEYMSPEQAQGEQVDVRSDLYSLGVILFEMLTGSVPFRSDSMVGILTQQVFDAPPMLRTIDPQLGSLPQVERLLARLLSKNRDERPPSALDARSMMTLALAADLGVGAATPGQAAAGARPTIAIGSWSVGDTAQAAGVFESQPARRGPQMRPPSNHVPLQAPPGFAPAGQVGGSAGHAHPAPARGVVIRADTPSQHIPAPAPGAPSHPAGQAQVAPAMPGKRRSGRLMPMVLLGAGAAIFAGLLTVGVVSWLDARRAQGAEVGVTSAEEAAESAVNGAVSAGPAAAPGRATAAAEPVEARESAAHGATDEMGEGSADPDREAGESAKTPASDKKKNKRGSSHPGKSARSKPGADDAQGEANAPDAKKGGSVKDPPAEPGVTLSDLKDPFL